MITNRRGRHPEDEGNAASGEHRACRPHERLGFPESDDDLQDRSGQDRGEDLGHTHVESEADLTQGVQGEDNGGHVQSGVTNAWKNDWIIAAQDAH